MIRHRCQVRQRVVIIETGLLLRIVTMDPRYLRHEHRRSSSPLLHQPWPPRQCRPGQESLLQDIQDKTLQRTEITAAKIRITAEITASQSVRGRGKIRQRLPLPLHEVGDKDLQPPKHHIKMPVQEIMSSNQTRCHRASLTLQQSITPYHLPSCARTARLSTV